MPPSRPPKSSQKSASNFLQVAELTPAPRWLLPLYVFGLAFALAPALGLSIKGGALLAWLWLANLMLTLLTALTYVKVVDPAEENSTC